MWCRTVLCSLQAAYADAFSRRALRTYPDEGSRYLPIRAVVTARLRHVGRLQAIPAFPVRLGLPALRPGVGPGRPAAHIPSNPGCLPPGDPASLGLPAAIALAAALATPASVRHFILATMRQREPAPGPRPEASALSLS